MGLFFFRKKFKGKAVTRPGATRKENFIDDGIGPSIFPRFELNLPMPSLNFPIRQNSLASAPCKENSGLPHGQSDCDLSRLDILRDELRALATAWPDDAVVREQFARALVFLAGNSSDPLRRDAMLAELRALSANWSHDASVRAHLATAIANTVVAAVSSYVVATDD
jgi:hypothetical protein